MLDLQNNIKSSQVCGPQPCELYFFPPNGIICAYFLLFGALLNLYIKCTIA